MSERSPLDGTPSEDAQSNDDSDGSDPDVIHEDLEPPVATNDLGAYDPAATHAEVEIGNEAFEDDFYYPHELRIWNQAGVPAIELRITDTMAGSVVHDERHVIPKDEELHVPLAALSEYRFQVRAPELDLGQRFSVPCFVFDCNESQTEVGVFTDGGMRSGTRQTVVGCPSYCEDHPDLAREAYFESTE